MPDFSLEGMQYQDDWSRLLRQLQQSGVAIDRSQMSTYRPGATVEGTGTPSQHAFGRAMDVNSRDNPVGFRWQWEPGTPGSNPDDPYGMDTAQDRPGQTVIPGPLARWAARNNNMTWGGDFTYTGNRRAPDPMHFQLNRNVPQAPLGGPYQVALGPTPSNPTQSAPTTATPAQPQYGSMAPPVQDRSLAGMMFGPNVAGSIRGIINNEAVRSGLELLTNFKGLASNLSASEKNQIEREQQEEQRRQFGMSYKLRADENLRQEAELGIKKAEETRKATLFGQEQQEKATRDKLFAEMYPGGKPNLQHPNFTGLSPEEAEAAYGLGPEEGLKKLGNLRFETATARAKFVEDMKRRQQMLEAWQRSQGGGAPQQAPPAAAPTAPGPGGPLPPELQPGTGGTPTPFQTPIPRAAPAQTQAPAAPAGGGLPSAGGAFLPPAGAPLTSQQGGLPIAPQAEPVAGMPGLPGYNPIDPYTNAAIAANILLSKEAADAV